MFNALAHLATDYTYTVPDSPTGTGIGVGVFLFMWLAALVLIVLVVCGLWKMYVKAGKHGWAALIPFYNLWVLAEIAGKPGWWGFYPLLILVPFVGWLAVIVVGIILALGVARNFGRSSAFGVIALWLFASIGYMILGYGSSTYKGNGQPSTAAPATPQAVPPLA